jgi:hypothetical protein
MIAVLVAAIPTCLEVVAPVVSAFEPRLSARRRFCKNKRWPSSMVRMTAAGR